MFFIEGCLYVNFCVPNQSWGNPTAIVHRLSSIVHRPTQPLFIPCEKTTNNICFLSVAFAFRLSIFAVEKQKVDN